MKITKVCKPTEAFEYERRSRKPGGHIGFEVTPQYDKTLCEVLAVAIESFLFKEHISVYG